MVLKAYLQLGVVMSKVEGLLLFRISLCEVALKAILPVTVVTESCWRVRHWQAQQSPVLSCRNGHPKGDTRCIPEAGDLTRSQADFVYGATCPTQRLASVSRPVPAAIVMNHTVFEMIGSVFPLQHLCLCRFRRKLFLTSSA